MITTEVSKPLEHLRRRLTFWYATTLSLILLLLGAGLYVTIHTQFAEQLHRSLRTATRELIRAARIREMETASAHGTVVDAVDELHIPDRALFLLDTAGVPIKPETAPASVKAIALRAVREGTVTDERDAPHERTISIHAERFRLQSGKPMVAVVAADQLELDDRFAALIAAFGGAALAAIVLVTAGAWFLAQKSIAPAERSLAYTRQFVADAAHELRTPIAVLRARSEVALQGNHSAGELRTAMVGMEAEARRLGRVVDDLLMLARADAGVRPVAKERFFLDDVVLDAAQSVRTLAQASDVSLELDEFDETAIEGDPALIRELVVVLLDNAVKFTPGGGRVRVKVKPHPTPTLTVEDTGEGIMPEQLPQVFDRFYRGDAARGRNGGAGLGLSIAQWVANAHNAVISLESERGRGTRAVVTFSRPIPA
jgi:signal transduction histidine kinase